MSTAGLAWRLAATVSEPALRLLLLGRLRRGKEIDGRLHERRGVERAPRPPGRLVWVHAASVGESNAVLPVLQALAERHALSVVLTTATAGAARLLADRIPSLGLQGRVHHRMAPLDVPRWIDRFLDAWRPDAAAFVESELWPNMLAALGRRGTPAALINARMSRRSARGWSRAPGLSRAMLSGFVALWARSDEDASRFKALGRAADRVGDLKDEAEPPGCDAGELAHWRRVLGDRPRWVAASTHPGEEEIVAAAHARVARDRPGLLTIVAPRHPERGAAVSALLGHAPRRSEGQGPPESGAGFWVFDTLGELGLIYRLAPLVLVGRSLSSSAAGGQNPLEPARLGCAIATGPQTANFEAAVARLREAGALTVVADAPALASWLEANLADPALAATAGERGRAVADRYSTLVEDTATMLATLAGA